MSYKPLSPEEIQSKCRKYTKHPQQLITYKKKDEELRILRGFRLSAKVLSKISKWNIENYYFFFGVRYSDLKKIPEKQRFTTIISGVDKDDYIIKHRMYDYLDPCPQKCVNNLPEPNAQPVSPPFINDAPIFKSKGFWSGKHIKYRKVERMQQAYAKNYKRLRLPNSKDPENKTTLYGLWFPKDLIDLILNNHNSDMKELFLMFAVYNDSDSVDDSVFTILVGGVKHSTNTFFEMYQHWDPCPARFPKGVDFLYI